MTKYEVMKTLRSDFDDEVLPHYQKRIFPKLKVLLENRCKREKKTINLGWEQFETSNKVIFKILKRGYINGDLPLFVCEFRWQGKLCFANFFPDEAVVVYQSHSMKRYAERVLNTEMDSTKVFYDYIAKKQKSAYNIVLPTPTHEFTHYFGIANALFLGDYDVDHPKARHIWCNTCISYNEARYTQSKILESLHEMQSFVEKYGDDLSKEENEPKLNKYLQKTVYDEIPIVEIKSFLIKKFLLWKLHLSFNFDFTQLMLDEISPALSYLTLKLELLGIKPGSLSPYSKTEGIAWKGEIDYKN